MGLNGLEPSTSRLSGVRSNQLSYRPIKKLKAGDENRTRDNSLEGCGFTTKLHPQIFLGWRGTESNCRHMELQSIALPTELPSQTVWTGLEPATSCVTGRHSNQLNYQTMILVFLIVDFENSKSIAGAGFEPTTFGL